MSNLAVLFEEARHRLPLKRLMEQYGRAPENGNWKSFPRCPYCGKDSAGVFAGGRGDLFKCHHSSCPSGTQHEKGAWDEIGFLAYESKLSRKEASITWLQQAGVRNQNMNLPATGSPNDQANAEPSHDHSNQFPGIEPPGEMTTESWCSDGAAAVPPTPSLFADGVNASPAESNPDNPPSPESGEASLSPAAAGAGESGAVANSTGDSTPPTNLPPDNPSGPPSGRFGPLEALREFYEQTTLTAQDLEKLWTKRGFTEELCVALGFRSSQRSNKDILLKLREKYSENVLVEACLWVRENEPGAKARPNAQYFGWGIRGKDMKGNEVFGWTFPILIPYLDQNGELLDLRVHKRSQKGQSPRLYIPRVLKQHRGAFGGKLKHPQFAVVVEGEFKAAALFQAVGNVAAVAALPGITMAKPLFADVEDWLAELDVRQVVVAYDNEEKGDKKFPGYKEEVWKRFDSEIWARYLALEIAKEGYESKVGHLPDAWRTNGKADWDGAMAFLRDQSGITEASPIEVWKNISGKIHSEFLGVFKEALPPEACARCGRFEREAENVISKRLRSLQARDSLPAGGESELIIARRLRRLYARIKRDGERMPPKPTAFLLELAKLYDDLKGGYYIFKRLSDPVRDRWLEILQEATNRDDVEVKRACELVLQGIPQRISDFVIEPMYVLRKANGKRVRVIRIHSMHGLVSEPLALPSAAYSQPSKLREWIFDSFEGATWGAGERELNALQYDLTRDTIYKSVIEVALRGFDDEGPPLRFFGDCAYTPEGKEIFADRNGIIWFEGKGYLPAEKDGENQKFVQGLPLMRPFVKFTEEETRDLFREISLKLYETIGNYSAYLVLGALLLYPAGQEFYEEYSAFPCLWIHGQSGQGKSSVARWGLRLHGFKKKTGISLPDSSKAGLGISLQQYGDLPVWLEEYQTTLVTRLPWLTEKLKEILGRESGVKKTYDEPARRIRTGVIVTGCATSSDEQLRSRFLHVLVAKQNRIKDHYKWFERTSTPKFYLVGRFLMRNRKEFAGLVMKEMEAWMESDALAGHSERIRMVHGAAYSAFRAMVAMLQSHSAEEVRGFRDYLLTHVHQATQEVQEQGYLQQFWSDVVAANKEGVFGEVPSERGETFKALADDFCRAQLSELQLGAGKEDPSRAWQSVRLYFTIDSILSRLRKWLKQQGREMPLDKNDLKSQMKVQGYWIEGDASEGHRQRFHGAKSGQRCWCVSLDKHPLGYRAVPDEMFTASFKKVDGNFFASEDWIDPRKGDLFALVDSLKSQRTSENSRQ